MSDRCFWTSAPGSLSVSITYWFHRYQYVGCLLLYAWAMHQGMQHGLSSQRLDRWQQPAQLLLLHHIHTARMGCTEVFLWLFIASGTCGSLGIDSALRHHALVACVGILQVFGMAC
jgi:hypothetical protein